MRLRAADRRPHEEPIGEWVIDVHERTLAALERAWERSSDRPIVRPVPDFLRPVAERSRPDPDEA